MKGLGDMSPGPGWHTPKMTKKIMTPPSGTAGTGPKTEPSAPLVDQGRAQALPARQHQPQNYANMPRPQGDQPMEGITPPACYALRKRGAQGLVSPNPQEAKRLRIACVDFTSGWTRRHG